ncbi:MAG: hypothetical protein LWX83_04800 [Anaerolineae bacterium]|nr:hypothetical protein [Anaerolineae bacterium]
MQNKKVVNILVPLIILLALICSATGLFWHDDGQPFTFTSLYGQKVEISGEGLYHYDSLFKTPVIRGTDVAVLALGIPLLLWAFIYYRRKAQKGALLLAGVLAFFLYNAASMALGAAYNPLFLIYILYFSASFFAFVLVLSGISINDLADRIAPGLPRKRMAVFLFFAGCSVFVWLIEIIGALAQGLPAPTGLGSYTTDTTAVFDLGIIAPGAFLSAVLLLRRHSLAYLLVPVILILNSMIGAVVLCQTAMQLACAVQLTPAQIIIYSGIFLLMSGFALLLTVSFFNNINEQGGKNSPMQELKAI